MPVPTLTTMFGRFPGLLGEAFPRWTRAQIDVCLTWALGPDWPEVRLDEVVLRLWKIGLVISVDDDPKDTLIAIRRRYHDMQWIDAARRYREEDDPMVPWH